MSDEHRVGDPHWIWDRSWADEFAAELPKVDRSWLAEQLLAGRTEGEVFEAYRDHGDPIALERILAATDRFTQGVTAEMRKTRPEVVRRHQSLRRSFESRLRPIWGEAFDSYDVLLVACHELSWGHLTAHAEQREVDEDFTCDVLVSLMARAVLTASEIGALLRSGHALGAIGRWRTLHEICVVAEVIAASDADIAERFRLHAEMTDAREQLADDLRLAEMGSARLLSNEDREELRQLIAELDGRFGPQFKRDNGWATPLFPDQKRIQFRDLRDLTEHRAAVSDYRVACHVVHSDSWGTELIHLEKHGEEVILTGPSNNRIEEIGVVASEACFQCLWTVVMHDDRDNNPALVGSLLAVRALVEDAVEAFRDGRGKFDAYVSEFLAIGGDSAPRWRFELLRVRRACRRARSVLKRLATNAIGLATRRGLGRW